MATVLVAAEYLDGQLADVTYELTGLARGLAGDDGSVVVAGAGPGFAQAASGVSANRVINLEGPGLDAYVPDAYIAALAGVARDTGADLVLTSTSAIGLDAAAGVAAALSLPLVSYVVAATRDVGAIVTQSQLYGGKLTAEAEVPSGKAVLTLVPGTFATDAGRGAGAAVETVTAAPGPGRMTFKQFLRPVAADVDITKEDILVSVGRGIESPDNISIVEELASALGGAISASRPVVDSGWLPKARQVGKSGVTVKPKLYVAVGISGAPEHLQGMKDADCIVAINSDRKAPIFTVAHYGLCGDLFDIVPAITELAKTNA